ncbi:flagellar hook protein FlgE [Desulfacinum hydrothermale DSM 13146]|uniref:Flagellar hook protein FlgE n=1 Tax=Desulfacinum hydrothermale DSM 13146 TaxID=1121390 RepID=A0A1W1X5R2_9BACT|nr:flagellar hook-basal body complex protein [Desulfacinum hydrothermale]SMC19252.1 flagellar hook protein FlgE [Desulfacinum hydrothermale DSM 13146]
MGISQAMNIGVSGLTSSATALTVVSDNIANVNTTSYKSNSVRFGDLVGGYYSTLSIDTDREGSGTAVMGIVTEFSQGSLQSTTRWSDLAINGDGFFSVKVPGSTTVYYTRDGGFHMDKDGYFVNDLGYRVLNRDGNEIHVDNPADPKLTDYSVDSNGQIWGTPLDPHQVMICDTDGTSSPKAYGSVYIQNPVSDGETITVTLQNTSGNQVDLAFKVGTDLTLNYDSDSDNTNDAFVGSINLSEFDLSGTNSILGSGTANEGSYLITGVADNGTSLTEDTDWMATSNDPQPVVGGQLRVSTFANNNGLIMQGNNLYTQGPESKFPIHGTANDGVRGAIFSRTIEASNVDLAKEMVNMITYQASYTANSKTITTASQLLDVAVNMVR